MKVVTFGELMLRLAPNGYYRFFQNDQMQATFGGGEANVAVSLANYGLDSTYVTKLPKHAVGQAAVDSLRYFGVDTSKIVRGGDRVGIYYLEKGASQRGSVCIYDRAHSAIAEAKPEDFDWDAIFEGADWFHFTGITPALGGNMVEICKQACAAAKKRGVKISCDLNYRGKLWTRDQARAAMTELCQYVDVCISNEEDAKTYSVSRQRERIFTAVSLIMRVTSLWQSSLQISLALKRLLLRSVRQFPQVITIGQECSTTAKDTASPSHIIFTSLTV